MWNNGVLLDQKKISRIFAKRYIIILVALLNMFLKQCVMAKVTKLPKSEVAVFHKYQNFIVLDAGSRGTRVSVFRIYLNMATVFDFDCEFHKKVDIGLSSPVPLNERIQSIRDLVDFAKSVIDEKEWGKTPIALKATAGVRDLLEKESDIILDKCQELLESSRFKVSHDSSSILSGYGEALSFWLSINLMLKRLRPGDTKNTVAVLDLGGGSAQLAGRVHKEDEVKFSYNVENLKIFGSNMKTYANSYPNLGLTRARRNILITEVASQFNGQINKVQWKCMNPNIDQIFEYEDEVYSITRPSYNSDKTRFELCLDLVHKYVRENSNIAPQLQNHDIYASSGFAYTADEAGLLSSYGEKKVTVKSYYDAGKYMCQNEKVDKKNPFDCLNLTYVFVLLSKSFNLSLETSINIIKEVDCHEVNWSLGFAFSEITNLHIE